MSIHVVHRVNQGAPETMHACFAGEPVMSAIERALESGFGRCFVIDRDWRLVGAVSLEGARRAILDGRLGATALEAMEPVEDALPFGGAHTPAGVAAALVDHDGRLAGVAVDQSKAFVPVAEPWLSRKELRYLLDAFLSTWISSQGAYIKRLEAEFTERMNGGAGVAVANGTVALQLAYAALGVGPGDEVIVPDLTFASTINTVLHVGATPVIVDVDPQTWCMDPDAVRAALSPRTRAIVPVHVFGRPAAMPDLMAIAAERELLVIEDAAEAHGATIGGRPVGSIGHAGCFSFFGNKNMTTGEGGMVLTHDPAIADRMRMLRDHGMNQQRRYWHDEVGFNFRMTNMQAALGVAQLERLDAMLAERAAIETLYREELDGLPGLDWPPQLPVGFAPVTWFVSATVPAEKRADLIAAARSRGVEVRPFFNALSAMPPYRTYGAPGAVAHRLAATGVNLPTSQRIDRKVARALADAFRSVLKG